MYLITQVLVLLYAAWLCNASYGIPATAGGQYPQSDVQAPAYVPPYLKRQNSKSGFSGYASSRSYSGTKTSSYSGTKTGYVGTKTGYSGMKSGYSGIKTGYSGTKTVYTGTKTGYSSGNNPVYGGITYPGGGANASPGAHSGYSMGSGTHSGYSIHGSGANGRTWNNNQGLAPSYSDFVNNANMPFVSKCNPQCKNNGICTDTNTCDCPENYYGQYCEFEKKPCLAPPPMPMNSRRTCSDEMCTITCMEGHKFLGGYDVTNVRCVDGQWQPTRAELTTIPDCVPQCEPPCQNGGICLARNTCQCPTDYRGPQCQYAASVCDIRKLAFNGGYKCSGDGEKFSCRLSCPAGSAFDTPAAELYTCTYATGVYLPQPIPHCVFEEVVVVTPSNYHGHGYENSHYVIHEHGAMDYTGHHHQNQIEVIQDLTPKGGSCLTWAGMHYKSFDGKIYSFKSACEHILLRDAREHTYTVAVKHGQCQRKAYCPTELIIYLDDKPYTLSVGEDGSVTFRSTKRLIPIPAALPGIRVDMPRDIVLVQLDAAGVSVKWDTNNMILIDGTVQVWNNTEGICGSLDGNPENDLTTKEGLLAKTKSVMASSWELKKTDDICESTPSEKSACDGKSEVDINKALKFCTKIFSKDKFRKCSEVMDVTLLLEACKWDYCSCLESESPEDCACNTAAVYAKECLRHGVEEMKSWRDAETCPMKCPDGKIYESCGAEFQSSCAKPELPSIPSNATCVEGCFCPIGLLLEGGKCIPPTECPCRLRNKNFPPGSTVQKDCNKCTCELGEWKCTHALCGARCGAVGDPHYTTFDGLKYDFMGHCSYTLLQADNLTVNVENVACSGAISEQMNLAPAPSEGKPSCTKAVTIMYEGVTIVLDQGGYVLVNDKRVSTLPVHIGNILIRAASSLFLVVHLPGNVELWWDGNTRVFIDVPPEFNSKTKGLCGTFNLNQRDDFLTPEGDVEQSALAFANKWKTREFCSDIDTKEPMHPCDANKENKETAEKYCSKLRSSLFEPCHWFVDVEPYYEECVYDMCACAGNVSRCLCPILGDYAMACAKHVQIQWRYNVHECVLQCSGGQEYTVCADSCQRTCTDVALSATHHCKSSCVEGCACPPGQVLDNTNVCVPIAMCPCFHKGIEFNAGYKQIRPGTKERELCTCVGSRWECVGATPADIVQYPAEQLAENCSAVDHLEFTTCELAEPISCKNMHLPPPPPSAECRPGCQCKKGYVKDMSSKKCVLATECPCHHGGKSYPDGDVMQEECNQCTCKNGKWDCTTRPCTGVCGAWGDSHLTTFDGNQYDFEGVCTYLLAKGAMDDKDGFDVEIQNAPCGTTGATCSKSVTLKIGSGATEEIVSLTKDAPLPDTSQLKRIKLRLAGIFVFLDVPTLGVSVQWDRALRVYLKLETAWQNRVKGLCGNFNGDMRDDFMKPGGGIPEASALIFADSWKLKPTCPKPETVKDHCVQRPERKDWAVTTCGALKRYPFTLCHTEVPPGPFVERCERDACACDAGDDCQCACAALAAYSDRCTSRGVTFKWRSQLLCPMQCDEECSNYDDCVSACPLETCDNTLHYAELKTVCQKDTCVEGCKPKKTCPEGSVYKNNSFTECVPRPQCKPVCMTLEDGRQILEGDIIEEDECHTCRCSHKQRVCTGQPCATTNKASPTPSTPAADEGLKCVTGWSEWLNRATPHTGPRGDSIDEEPLPLMHEMQIGSPMCKKEMMTDIECRTVVDHETPKETRLNVECSLERGLYCEEKDQECPDFEMRVYCECEKELLMSPTTLSPTVSTRGHRILDEELKMSSTPSSPTLSTRAHRVLDEEPFQCMNANHPSEPHPTDCNKFYECTPDMLNLNQIHTVLKACAPGLMYNPTAMVCDWPAAVKAIRPECAGEPTTAKNYNIVTQVTSVPEESECPPGHVYEQCAYPCTQLCHHYRLVLQEEGKCKPGEKCVAGCVDKNCMRGSVWRDADTCVAPKDCTCFYNNTVLKPGATVTEGCKKCQCLNNDLHCDTRECTVPPPVVGPTHEPYILPSVGTLPPVPQEVTEATSPKPAVSLQTQPTVATPSITSPVPTEGSSTVLIIKTTVSPPPECSPDGYVDLMWGDQPLPDAAITASSFASPMFEPKYAKLDGQPSDKTGGSWNPAVNDNNQYIQVELPRREPVYGVKMQGSPIFNQYVTSYEIIHSDDGVIFSTIDEPDGTPKVFRGPIEHNVTMKQMIEPPIEAKVIRIKPLTWNEEIAVRLELIGCQETLSTAAQTTGTTPRPPPMCSEPLGLAADLPLENIEVSSNNEDRNLFRMNGQHGWKPIYSMPGEWILFDFTAPRNITGITTKGGPQGWVSVFNIMYTCDLTTFNPIVDSNENYKQFPGNYDKDTAVTNEFYPPIHARYLKILPMKWEKVIEMRIEPLGCFEEYPTIPTLPQIFEEGSTPRNPICTPCPGITVAGADCPCTSPDAKYFDGQRCVSRDQCPCIVDSIMSYVVGSTFRKSNCDECICKLGGVADCKPVTECKCAPDLVPKLTQPECECVCEPCANGTKICPTSKLCLSLEKWCDGLQDCPDDEVDCYVTKNVPTEANTPPPTTVAPTTVAEKPDECPKVECPIGYVVHYTPTTHASYSIYGDLPPPRERKSYQNFYRPGSYRGTKTGNSRGYSKGGYQKSGYSTKGGYSGGYSVPGMNQAFTLNKPSIESATTAPETQKKACTQFKCVPKLPPFRPGVTTAPLICSAPQCPPHYSLRLESPVNGAGQCPQYICVPPPERPVYCNVTGRTITTFDGSEYKYDICYHILARENRVDAWTVLARKKCRVEGCQNELMVKQDDQLIVVKPSLLIEYENYEYTIDQTNKICFQKNSFSLSQLGNGLLIKSRKYNFTVQFNPDGDIKIGVPKSYKGSVDGLCGTYDEDKSDDRQLPDGSIASSIDQFGQAWGRPGLSPDACKIKTIPPDDKKRIYESCDVVTKQPLAQCGSVLNLEKWRTICMEKICECIDQVVNGTKRTERECRCLVLEQLVGECLSADKNADVAGWRVQMDCPSECPSPLVHHDCYRKRCEPTCGELGVTGTCPNEEGVCFPGCYCPEGKLRKGDQCITPPECRDCICDGVSSPTQYVTFERDDMPFIGNCTYLVSRDRNETGHHAYEIYTSNGPCEDNSDAVCTQTVHVIYQSHVMHITKNAATKKLVTTIDKELVFKYPLENDWTTVSLVKGQDLTVIVPEAYLELRVMQAKLEFSIRVPSHVYANQTQGLCGVCAGYDERLFTSNGTETEDLDEYGKSWQAKPEALKILEVPSQEQCDGPPPPEPCSPPEPEKNPCYELYNADKFGACHALVPPDSFLESCEVQLCNNQTDVCETLERYADECRRLGVCLNWRVGTSCPYYCQDPFVYQPCVDCERTCDNNKKLTEDPKKCKQEAVEGCFCPEGKVRVKETCIEPKKCFPCDAENNHYAGDEWQENECKSCKCSMVEGEKTAHVACTTQTCATPVCSAHEDMISKPARPGQCCQEYICMPKAESQCVEPKKMECGYGQVLKQKTLSSGCKEFTCECKPPSECEKIPSENEVEPLEPGIERSVDNTGCCPKVNYQCKPETCPEAPECPKFHDLKTENVTGKCCPTHKCELPKDKCVVNLEWEAAPKGGEKHRDSPQVTLKDVESVWLDGPCRSCRCVSGAGADAGPRAQCSVSECPALTSTDDFVVEPRPVPFKCCAVPEQVACRHNDNIYKVGENWTSPDNVCQSYQCVRLDDGSLDKVTTVQQCETNCQPGWKYFEATPESGKCCGSCQPVACVCEGIEHPIGEKWRSPDFCTNYTCVNVDGTMQIQSTNETCPKASLSMKHQYVVEEKKVEGQCCSVFEAVACKEGSATYQEGEKWVSTRDPCISYECVKEDGKLAKETSVQICDTDCQVGSDYVPSVDPGKCCGSCVPVRCVCEGVQHDIGSVWYSADHCANYTCVDNNGTLQITMSNETCVEISESLKKQFEYDEKRVANKCCSVFEPVACRYEDKVYQIGENWTSPYNPCESYECVSKDGKLEKITTVQACDDDCKPGWKYFPAEAGSGKCCGSCRPVSCVVDGVERPVGERWTSADFCTKYTCLDVDGNLQVQTANETCPTIPVEMLKEYVYKQEKVPGKCCKTQEIVACRVGNDIYQEGQTWQSDDPCKNVTCARDASGRLTRSESVEQCTRTCSRGWEYLPPPRPAPPGQPARCCGHCVQRYCILGDELKAPGTTWQSDDNCTTYYCDEDLGGESVSMSSARPICPDVSECEPEDLYNDTCCQVCRPKPSALSKCVPVSIPGPETVGLVRVTLGALGVCVNKQPVPRFSECRGNCDSATLYNNQTGSHESSCSCCTSVRTTPLDVTVTCADNSQHLHMLLVPAQCSCQKCGATVSGTKTGNSHYAGVKNTGYGNRNSLGYITKTPAGHYAASTAAHVDDYAIPEIFARMGEND